MTKISKPGIYDLTLEEYHGDPCVEHSISSSGLRLIMNECPAKYWAQCSHNPDRIERESAALDVGKAAHDLMLFGELQAGLYHLLPKGFNRAATKKFADEIAEYEAAMEAGKTALKHDQVEVLRAMHKQFTAHPIASAAFSSGTPEQSLIWKDEETGVWLRARPDFLPENLSSIPEYKTAASGRPEDFAKAMWNYGYHMQAAFCLEGIRAVTGEDPEHFYFVVQEKAPPYLVTLMVPDRITLEWGDIQNRKAIRTFAECLERDHWPGYSDEVVEVQLPVWAERGLQDRHEQGEFTQEVAA